MRAAWPAHVGVLDRVIDAFLVANLVSPSFVADLVGVAPTTPENELVRKLKEPDYVIPEYVYVDPASFAGKSSGLSAVAFFITHTTEDSCEFTNRWRETTNNLGKQFAFLKANHNNRRAKVWRIMDYTLHLCLILQHVRDAGNSISGIGVELDELTAFYNANAATPVDFGGTLSRTLASMPLDTLLGARDYQEIVCRVIHNGGSGYSTWAPYEDEWNELNDSMNAVFKATMASHIEELRQRPFSELTPEEIRLIT